MAQSLLLQYRWIWPRWGCVTSVRWSLHCCSRVWWGGSSSQQELPWDCSYWHSIPAAWALSSLNLSQKAPDLAELEPREIQGKYKGNIHCCFCWLTFTPLVSYYSSYEKTTWTSFHVTQKYYINISSPHVFKWLNCVLLRFCKPVPCQAQTGFVVWFIIHENVTNNISITQRYKQASSRMWWGC